jgi:acetyltransferase-like isoleucine patch superfamily enzyme
MNILNIVRGFIVRFIKIAIDGARDFKNRKRFSSAIIDEGCSFNNKTKLGYNSRVLSNCVLNNSELGSFSYVGKNCLIQNTIIGKYCSIANNVSIGLGKHPTKHFTTSPLFYKRNNTFKINLVDKDLEFSEYKKTIVENDVWIGYGAIVLDGIKISNGAIIGAGSIVTKDIPPYAIAVGIPAKIIKYRFDNNKIDKLIKSSWWDNDPYEIKKTIKHLNNL